MREIFSGANSSREIKVLVVDDSALMRTLIANMLNSDGEIKVVGTACDGLEAIRKVSELKPDVVTLDIEMPKLNGLAALKEIRKMGVSQVVMVTGLDEAGIAAEALRLGAIDVVLKPSGTFSVDIEKIKDELVQKVKIAASSKKVPLKITPYTTDIKKVTGLVVIGASTGGPRVLDIIFSSWTPDFPLPVLVVQHIPNGFCYALADSLNTRSKLSIKVAREKEELQPGRIYIAPGGVHLVVKARGEKKVFKYDNSPPVYGVKPSADISMISAAQVLANLLLEFF